MKRLNLLTAAVLSALSLPRYSPETGIARQIRYKKETSNGTIASGATGGQTLRRVTSTLQLSKDTHASNEKTSHRQDIDFRHGMRKVGGNITGELSPSTYADFMDSLVARARTAVTDITGLSITIAAVVGPPAEYTITRAAGDFLADGIKVGMVVRLTAGAFNANNLNKNIVVRAVTATVITGKPLSSSLTLTAEGPVASATLSVPGKVSYMPTSGHTDESYTIEDYFPTLTKSEQFTGCEIDTMKVTVPASGICTVEFGIMGLDIQRTSAVYFVSPTEETTTGLTDSSTAMYIIGGSYNTDITNLDFTWKANKSAPGTSGSQVAIAVFGDKLQAEGTMSMFFEDTVARDAFIDETATSVNVIVAVDQSADSDFVAFAYPKVKLNGAGKDDPNTGIQQSIPWKALYNSTGGASTDTEKTTAWYQDSAAT